MALINNFSNPATDPLRNFRFLVDFAFKDAGAMFTGSGGLKPQLGFTSVSGLAMSIESIPYREGGYNTTVHQIPGQTSFSPITLSRGMTIGPSQNYQWTKALFSTIAGQGTQGAGHDWRANVNIQILDHPVTNDEIPPVKMRVKVNNAWISSIAYSDLNAGDNALLVEQITLVHEGFQVTYAAAPGAGEAAAIA